MMTSLGCERFREELVAYVQGELAPLPKAHIESHVGHCESCALVVQGVAQGLVAVRCWRPSLDDAALGRLNQRLTPYVESARVPLGNWLVGGFALAAASLLAVIATGVWGWTVEEQRGVVASQEIATAPSWVSAADFAKAVPDATLERTEVTPYVRMLAPTAWQGSIERQGRQVSIALDSGFVAISFVGGEGRRLRVKTPSCVVDVVGTRFSVAVVSGATVVSVESGAVDVWMGAQRQRVLAGDSQVFAANGPLPASDLAPAWMVGLALNDDFLRQHDGAKPGRTKGAWGRRQQGPAALQQSSAVDGLQLWARAEELAKKGQFNAAFAAYERIASGQSPELLPFKSAAAYEAARIVGLQLGQKERALSMLVRLQHVGDGEVRRQARLAQCELQLNEPCVARRCLENFAKSDGAMRQEVRFLLQRWGLQAACPSQEAAGE